MTETEATARAALAECAAATTALYHLLHGIAASVPPSPHESGPHDIPEPADFATELHGDLASMTGELEAMAARLRALASPRPAGRAGGGRTGETEDGPVKREPMSLVQVLVEAAGAVLGVRRETSMLAVAELTFPSGRTMLLIERTYSPGLHVILDPTPEELELAANSDLWGLRSSARSVVVGEMV